MNDIVKQLHLFNQQNVLFCAKDRILLAISGGMDSMLMFHLFKIAQIQFGVAHVNFRLRGKESDDDAKFVEKIALNANVPYYSTAFDTLAYAARNGLSVEMAARELRYAWFEEIRSQNNFQFIATAHHINDSVETFFLNTLRAGGINSLTGIAVKNEYIIRPLMFLSRKSITEIVQRQKIAYRSDYTNNDTGIARNKVRHHIIPEFEKLMPEFTGQIYKTMSYLKQANDFIDYQLEKILKAILIDKISYQQYNFTDYIMHPGFGFILHKLFSEKGFSGAQLEQMQMAISGLEFAHFSSKKFEIYAGKMQILLEEIKTTQTIMPEIILTQLSELKPFFRVSYIQQFPDRNYFKSQAPVECLILEESLLFPLKLRHWKSGDYFMPFGMSGIKKLSDFLTDLKLNPIEKKRIKVLENAKGEIMWVIGYRTDNRYKVNNKLGSIIKLIYNNLD